MRNVKLKTAGFIVAAVLALTGAGFTFVSISVNAELHRIQAIWATNQIDRSEKARLESALRAAMGYGGMIHNFKNAVLRQDPALYDQTMENVGAAVAVLAQYRALGLSAAELVALGDVEDVVRQYQANIDIVRRMKGEKATNAAIDVVVKVDDTPALRGLATLKNEARGAAQVDRPVTKARLVADLRAEMGFGGMIHALKNYVLRGRKNYYNVTLEKIDGIYAIIDAYQGLGPTDAEAMALADISETVGAYSTALLQAKTLNESGKSVEEIDAEVRLEDRKALRGLQVLDREVIAAIEAETQSAYAAIGETLGLVAAQLRVIAPSIVVVTFLILWLMFFHIIAPIRTLTRVMDRLTHDDMEIAIPFSSLTSEIGVMARALQVFRDNVIERRKVEDKYAEANEELERQIVEINEFRDRAQDEAGRAIALAENFALAREGAERAHEEARDQQKRVQAILDTVRDAIITINVDGHIETFNRGAEDLFGYRSVEIIGRNVNVLMPEPHATKHVGYLEKYVATRESAVIGVGRELEAKRKDGTLFPIELAVTVMEVGGAIKFTGVIHDITERKEAEAEIKRLAMTDPLTGCANRNQFNIKLEEALALSKRSGHGVGLMLFDLDKFKSVNDTYGHPTGDALLVHMSEVLKDACREIDTIARLGGDEFAVILAEMTSKQAEAVPAQRIIDELAKPIVIEGHTIHTGTSIGVAFFPEDAASPEELYAHADMALYVAKKQGRGTYRFFQSDTKE